MNNFKRKKLGLPKKDYLKDIKKSEQKISTTTPISLNKSVKDFNAYSKIDLKTINIGTLRKPVEKLVAFDNETQAYYSIELKNTTAPKFYFQESLREFVLNGSFLTYKSNFAIDQNNPYDPLFASFNRLPSKPTTISVISGVTGINQGEQEKFFSLSSGFSKTQNIVINTSGFALNGVYTPLGLINNKPRYVNSSIPIPADMIWFENYGIISGNSGVTSGVTSSGWLLRQRRSRSLAFDALYFISNNEIPTGNNWSITGSSLRSGTLPLPISEQLELEGFFKLASTRISRNKNRIYSSFNGNVTGSTSGILPSPSVHWVTYPHSYNIQSFPALRYNSIITYGNDSNKISDILIISTGISSKKIIYVSPHNIESFAGFWAELASSNRTPITGIGGRVINNRDVYRLQSGNLIGLSSYDFDFSGLNYIAKISSGYSQRFYNLNQAQLKQTIPIKDTWYYKLYEPVYRKNTFNTGSWNGIIPSGTPFSIETIRLKNSEITTPTLNIYLTDSFVLASGGSGVYQYIQNPSGKFGSGFFYGTKVASSSNNQYEASYFADSKALKRAKSKLYGYLWEKGILKGNAKSRKMLELMSRLDLVKNNPKGGIGKRCKTYINPSDPTSCSYTGYANLPIRNWPSIPVGVETSAGLRLSNNNLIEHTYISGKKIGWKKILPYDYATVQDIPPGIFGCFTLSGDIRICIDPPPPLS